MPVTGPLQYHYRMRVRSHLTPNGNQNPGELRGAQLAFVPIRWDMPCRIDRSRDLRSQRRTQGVASLYPGLSHFAPLGRGDRRIIVEVQWIDRSDRERSRRVSDESVNPAVAPLPLDF